MTKRRLADLSVLIVEDQYLVARDLARTLREAGAVIVGPAQDMAHARELLASADPAGAILDINLADGTSYALADELAARGVPYLFVTGYGNAAIEPRYRHVPMISKPFTDDALIDLARQTFGKDRKGDRRRG